MMAVVSMDERTHRGVVKEIRFLDKDVRGGIIHTDTYAQARR